jgi:hypothetical protein
MHYYFCCVHQTLRVTHAMEAGIAEPVWTLEELVAPLARVPSNQPHESHVSYLPIFFGSPNNLFWLRSVRHAAIFRRMKDYGGMCSNNLAV